MMTHKRSLKLTGLSSEQMNVFCLKNSVECANSYWNMISIEGPSEQQSKIDSKQLFDHFTIATVAFRNVIKSAEQQKDAASLHTFLSEIIMISYLRLSLVFFGIEVDRGLCDSVEKIELSGAALFVLGHCLKCMESVENSDRLLGDFTEGVVYLVSISIKALKPSENSTAQLLANGSSASILRFAIKYTNALASMSRKYTNRKKLYTIFCNRLLGPCLKMLEVMELSRYSASAKSLYDSLFQDFRRVLENLIENSLFFDDKNVEDLATAIISLPVTAKGDTKKPGANFKASYHGGLFDALTSLCSGIGACNVENGVFGYPTGIATVLQVYSRCSHRILAASLDNEANTETSKSEVLPVGKPSTTLQDRRKHTIRVLNVSLMLLALADSSLQERFIRFLDDNLVQFIGECTSGLVSSLVACVHTQRAVLISLSSALDETGGYSILATHDSLQPLAKRLHDLCSRLLIGASTPLLAFLSPSLCLQFMTMVRNSHVDTLVDKLLLEAQSVQFDSIRILAGIDHRAITARLDSENESDPSLVLQGIAGVRNTTLTDENLLGTDQSQIIMSKEKLLLYVITLYDDLRRMDDFVSEVRGVCRTDAPSLFTFVELLGGQEVQGILSKAFAGLPASQLELVWISLSVQISKKGAKSSYSLKDRIGQICQSVIISALLHATTIVSSSAVNFRKSSSSHTAYSRCDSILQVGASISLSSPLLPGIVNAMTSLYQESVVTLQLLESAGEEDMSIAGVRYERFDHVFEIISMLLQLGSAAIVLHKSFKDPADDSWLKFRQCASATAALLSLQNPAATKEGANTIVCMPAAIVLLNLSSFLATCDSLKLTVCKELCDSPKDFNEVPLIPLNSKEIDVRVLQMILISSEVFSLRKDGKNSKVVESTTKRGRQGPAALKVQVTCSSVNAIDFLLLYTRSVSVWRHLVVEPRIIATLTLAHFKDMAVYFSDPESVKDHLLFAKHTCLYRLMQLVSVQDCAVLVEGFLLAIDTLLRDCSESLSAEATQSSAAQSPRAKSAKSSVDIVPLSVIFLFAHVASASSSSFSISLPIDSLLSASAAALTNSSHRSPNCGDVIASIAHHSSSVISHLLSSSFLTTGATAKRPSVKRADTKIADHSANNKQRMIALDAASNVLNLCLRYRPVTQSEKSVTPLSPNLLHPHESNGISAHAETSSWSIVDLQLKDLIKPLVNSVCTRMELLDCINLHSLVPIVVDFLLQNSFIIGSICDNPHFLLSIISESVLDVFSRSVKDAFVLKFIVENFRRVCSYYCAMPADVINSTAALAAVKAIADHLLLKLLPSLELREVVAENDCLYFDSCCFLAADTLRLYAKCSEAEAEVESKTEADATAVEGSDVLLCLKNLPSLPMIAFNSSLSLVLDGWFLLVGTILLLQRRSGKLLTIQGATLFIDKVKQAILLASSSSSLVVEETLMFLGLTLQGLVGIVPHVIRSSVGDMLLDLAQQCACSAIRINSTTVVPSSSGPSVSSSRLSRFVVIGVDCLLSASGQYDSNFDLRGKETNSSLGSARAMLECIAVSCAGRGDMLAQPEVVLAVISGLRRGITTIQQQQQKGRRRLKRMRTNEQEHSEVQENDEAESSKGREHALSQWASCCFSVLSKIIPRLLKGNGGVRSKADLSNTYDMVRVNVSAHALCVLEQIFACDSVGGSSLPLLGNSIGTLGALLTTAIRVIVAADEMSNDGRVVSSAADLFSISNALRVAGRTLTAASSSKELNRHAHVLSASVVDLLAQRPIGTSTRELLLPGLFALFDRCKQKQRLQMFATVNAQTRAVLSDLHGAYLRDFKFTGQ